MVYPEPCKELRRRISAAISGWDCLLPTFICPGFDCGSHAPKASGPEAGAPGSNLGREASPRWRSNHRLCCCPAPDLITHAAQKCKVWQQFSLCSSTYQYIGGAACWLGLPCGAPKMMSNSCHLDIATGLKGVRSSETQKFSRAQPFHVSMPHRGAKNWLSAGPPVSPYTQRCPSQRHCWNTWPGWKSVCAPQKRIY